MIKALTCVALFSCFLVSCGYQLGAATGENARKVNERGGVLVKIQQNLTLNRELEPPVRNQTINQLGQQGIKTSDDSQNELRLVIRSIDYRALRNTNINVLAASEYQTTITVGCTLWVEGKKLQSFEVEGKATFFAGLADQSLDESTVLNSSFVQASQHSYPQAVLNLAEEIAQQIAIGF